MKANSLWIFPIAAACVLLASQAAASSLEIRFAAPPEPGAPAQLGAVVVHDLDHPERPPFEVEVASPGPLAIDTAGGGRWRLRLKSRDFWAADRELGGEAASSPWLLYPVARYRLTRARTTPLPAEIFASFAGLPRPGSPDEPPAGRVRCEGDGRFQVCALPAVPLDLRIEPAGFAPIFFWDQAAKAGSTQELGVLQLVAGASLAGRIVDGNGEPLVADLEAHPAANLDPGAPDSSHIRGSG